MAKSKREELDQIVVRLVAALIDEHGPFVDRVSVYPAHSGEYPYQVEVRGETLPLAGLAIDPEGSERFAAAQTRVTANGSDLEAQSG